jgi:hypothetical protein
MLRGRRSRSSRRDWRGGSRRRARCGRWPGSRCRIGRRWSRFGRSDSSCVDVDGWKEEGMCVREEQKRIQICLVFSSSPPSLCYSPSLFALTPSSLPSFHPYLPAQVTLLESVPTHTPFIRQMQRLEPANVHRRAAAAAAARSRSSPVTRPHLGTQKVVAPFTQLVQRPRTKDLPRAFLEQGTRLGVVCLG